VLLSTTFVMPVGAAAVALCLQLHGFADAASGAILKTRVRRPPPLWCVMWRSFYLRSRHSWVIGKPALRGDRFVEAWVLMKLWPNSEQTVLDYYA
jgi:hypothetical protein